MPPTTTTKADTMEWVETTGRTIAEALDTALDELGCDEDDVEYEVVAEPKSGFLRLGSSDARIRARVKPISREKPGERQRRKGGRGGSRPRGDSNRGDSNRSDAGRAAATPRQNGEEATTSPNRRRRSRGGRGGGGGGGGGTRPAGGGANEPRDKTEQREQREQRGSTVETTERDVPIEEQAEAAETFTQGLVDAFELGARAKSVIEDDIVLVDVTGDNLGLLVGPKGATLHAIEELVRTVVQRQTDGHGARIHVDVAGYRAKRRAALEVFTRELADRVIETGRAQGLEPMSASDRKVVHDTAAEIDGVATESEGEDPRRRVILRPA